MIMMNCGRILTMMVVLKQVSQQHIQRRHIRDSFQAGVVSEGTIAALGQSLSQVYVIHKIMMQTLIHVLRAQICS